jgi:hypothetical protein
MVLQRAMDLAEWHTALRAARGLFLRLGGDKLLVHLEKIARACGWLPFDWQGL